MSTDFWGECIDYGRNLPSSRIHIYDLHPVSTLSRNCMILIPQPHARARPHMHKPTQRSPPHAPRGAGLAWSCAWSRSRLAVCSSSRSAAKRPCKCSTVPEPACRVQGTRWGRLEYGGISGVVVGIYGISGVSLPGVNMEMGAKRTEEVEVGVPRRHIHGPWMGLNTTPTCDPWFSSFSFFSFLFFSLLSAESKCPTAASCRF